MWASQGAPGTPRSAGEVCNLALAQIRAFVISVCPIWYSVFPIIFPKTRLTLHLAYY